LKSPKEPTQELAKKDVARINAATEKCLVFIPI